MSTAKDRLVTRQCGIAIYIVQHASRPVFGVIAHLAPISLSDRTC